MGEPSISNGTWLRDTAYEITLTHLAVKIHQHYGSKLLGLRRYFWAGLRSALLLRKAEWVLRGATNLNIQSKMLVETVESQRE